MSIAKNTLAEFDDEMARTRKVLAAIPAEHMDWSVDPSMRSIGWNANHIADILSWTEGILEHSEFDFAPVDGPHHETPSISDPKVVLEQFDRALASARAAFSAASDETLGEDWALKMGGETLQTLPKGACIRKWILNHTIHHRGILSVYLRLCGVDLLPIYDG